MGSTDRDVREELEVTQAALARAKSRIVELERVELEAARLRQKLEWYETLEPQRAVGELLKVQHNLEQRVDQLERWLRGRPFRPWQMCVLLLMPTILVISMFLRRWWFKQ